MFPVTEGQFTKVGVAYLYIIVKNNSLIKYVIFRKPNIFDNMIAMMEKYANNLEVLVDERTDQLQEEKKKTGMYTFQLYLRYFSVISFTFSRPAQPK